MGMTSAWAVRSRLTSPPIAIALLAIVIAGIGGTVPLGVASRAPAGAMIGQAIALLPFAVVGALVALRQARNPIGWVLLGAATFFVLQDVGSVYSVLDYRLHHGTLPLGALAVLFQPSWAPAIVLISITLLLFPDGELLRTRSRWVVWGLASVGVVWLAGAYAIAVNAVVEHGIRVDGGGNLLQIDRPSGAWAWWAIAQDLFFLALGATLLYWLVFRVAQYRRSAGERRLQLKWLGSGAAASALFGTALLVTGSSSTHLGHAVGDIATAGLAVLPISIGVGIFKFHLYEIDRIVSRTISYATLTALLLGVYVGVVTVVTKVLPFSSSAGLAASTLAAVALFNPLRRRVQRLIDRRFNRARYDAEATVAAFSAHLRGAIDLEAVQRELIEVVHRAFEPEHISVWLKRRQPG